MLFVNLQEKNLDYNNQFLNQYFSKLQKDLQFKTEQTKGTKGLKKE